MDAISWSLLKFISNIWWQRLCVLYYFIRVRRLLWLIRQLLWLIVIQFNVEPERFFILVLSTILSWNRTKIHCWGVNTITQFTHEYRTINETIYAAVYKVWHIFTPAVRGVVSEEGYISSLNQNVWDCLISIAHIDV